MDSRHSQDDIDQIATDMVEQYGEAFRRLADYYATDTPTDHESH